MAGSILGADQVARLNAAYPALVAHIRALLGADRTPAGLMRVHVLTEYLDTTELARIFSGLSFISPAEKRALVRAAIFDVLVAPATSGGTLEIPQFPAGGTATFGMAESKPVGAVPLKEFTPPGFKLNVTKSEGFTGQRPADTPPPAPIVTNTKGTVSNKVEAMRLEGSKQEAEQQAALDKAADEVRATPASDVK